jgi:hypothetical protein
MWKGLLIGLFMVAACKEEDSPAPAPPAPAPATAPAAPTARPRPHLDTPSLPPAAAGSDTPAGTGSDERAEFRKQRAEKMRQRLDSNGDGKITVDELKNAGGRMKFDDPAAIDIDHDGVISNDELDAAMKARREQQRERWRGGRGSGGSGDGNSGANGAM